MFEALSRIVLIAAMILMATLVSLVPAGAVQACTTGSLAVVAPQDVRLGGGRGLLPFRRNVRAQLAPRAAVIVPQQVIVPHSQTLIVPQQQLIVPQQQTLLLVR